MIGLRNQVMKMTEFRWNRLYEKNGISYKKQGKIFFDLVNLKKGCEEYNEALEICKEITKKDAEGLCRFLTDISVNHNYIFIEYGINTKQLFEYKKKFYEIYSKRV